MSVRVATKITAILFRRVVSEWGVTEFNLGTGKGGGRA